MEKLEEAADDNKTGLPSVFNEDARRDLVFISSNVLRVGQNLTVTAVTDESSLSEITLHTITGSKVYRKSVSGNECTLQVPVTSGIYMLRVCLNDNSSRTFKVLVK